MGSGRALIQTYLWWYFGAVWLQRQEKLSNATHSKPLVAIDVGQYVNPLVKEVLRSATIQRKAVHDVNSLHVWTRRQEMKVNHQAGIMNTFRIQRFSQQL